MDKKTRKRIAKLEKELGRLSHEVARQGEDIVLIDARTDLISLEVDAVWKGAKKDALSAARTAGRAWAEADRAKKRADRVERRTEDGHKALCLHVLEHIAQSALDGHKGPWWTGMPEDAADGHLENRCPAHPSYAYGACAPDEGGEDEDWDVLSKEEADWMAEHAEEEGLKAAEDAVREIIGDIAHMLAEILVPSKPASEATR